MNLKKELLNMLKLLGRLFWIFISFSFLSFGEDFERLCNEEVLKEEFNITVVQNYCGKVAQKYKEEGNVENAFNYYLFTDNLNEIFDYQEDENSSFLFYLNRGHAYILNNNLEQAKDDYENVLTFDIDVDKNIQEDYHLLKKIYPHKKELLTRGLKIWNASNKKILQILKLTKEYDKLYNSKEYDMMINKLNEIISLKNKTILKNFSSTMMDYYHLAFIHEQRKHYRRAKENYLLSLKIATKILPKKHLQIGTIHNSLGLVDNELKLYKEAEDHYLKALTIYLQELGKEDNLIAIIYNNLATIYGDNQKHEKAISFYRKALAIEEKNPSIKIIHTYYNIGLLYQQIREYDKVLPVYKKTLPFIKNIPLEMATYYSLVGAYHQEIEENQKSLFFYKKALAIRLKKLETKNVDISESYNALGSIYEVLKDFKKALYFYKKAIEINKSVLDKNDNFIAISYNNIASIYTNLEQYKQAKKNLLYALKIKQNIFRKDDIDFAVTYTNLGFIEEKLQDYKEASDYYAHALSIYKSIKGEDSLEVAIVYNHIASLYKEQKSYKTSLHYLKKSKNIINQLVEKNHSQKSLIYNNIGLLYGYTKAYKKSYEHNIISFNIFLHNRNKNFKTLDTKQKSLYIESFGNRIDNLYNSSFLYTQDLNNKLKTKILNTILSSWFNYKGTLFEYQNILSMIKNNHKTPVKVKKSIQDLNALTIRRSKEENNTLLKEKIHAIEINLSQQNDSFRELLELKDIDYKKVSSKLKPHQLYIDFARSTNHYYIFTLDSNSTITFQQIDENNTKIIDIQVQAYQNNTQKMADSIQKNTVVQDIKNSKQQAQTILSVLYNKIIQNHLMQQISNKRQLIISPDGLLNYFPFEALYHNGHYLVEKYTINYISSGKEFLRQNKLLVKNPKNKITIFANANFDAKLKAYFSKEKENILGPWIATQEAEDNNKHEAKELFDNLGRSEIKIIQKHYKNPLIYEDENATVSNLMNFSSSEIVHLSTHGIFRNDDNITNPMTKSFLIFSGGNQGNNVGFVSALQLSTLDLSDTTLVILSACQSGLGDMQNAEGIVGLPKALLQAGAKNVIMSLWTVSNLKTTKLMENFYDSISKQKNYSQALQEAKKKMIKEHPYYWSAFILSGI